jgi:hypothetical protein
MTPKKIKYLFYESTGKSQITIPRVVIESNELDWEHGDEIKLVIRTIDGKKGVFLYKK